MALKYNLHLLLLGVEQALRTWDVYYLVHKQLYKNVISQRLVAPLIHALLFHCYFIVISLLFHCYSIVISLLFEIGAQWTQ